MTDILTAGAGIGAIIPALVAVVVRSSWPGWVKALIALLSSVAGGVIAAAAAGDLTGASLLQGALVVLAASQAFYRLWWKPSGIAGSIERHTQPVQAPPFPEAMLRGTTPKPLRARRAASPEEIADDADKHRGALVDGPAAQPSGHAGP